MKKHDRNRKFGRERNGRRALLRSLARSLVLHGHITTTEARAKELRPFIERIVTHAKTDNVASRRLVAARLGNAPETTKKLFTTIGPRFKARQGGYTRVVRIGRRPGDASMKAYIGFVE